MNFRLIQMTEQRMIDIMAFEISLEMQIHLYGFDGIIFSMICCQVIYCKIIQGLLSQEVNARYIVVQ